MKIVKRILKGILIGIGVLLLMMKSGQIIWKGSWDDNEGTLEDFYLKKYGED